LPSLHADPFVLAGFEQAPLTASQVPGSWHWSDAVQVLGVPGLHAPARQVSLCVQAFPSLHVVPLAATGFEHTPVDGLHVPAVWHWSDAAHVFGLLLVHMPDRQTSVRVQAFPSLHAVPLVATGFEHAPVDGLHAPAVWH
jgi:hypothetical protein